MGELSESPQVHEARTVTYTYDGVRDAEWNFALF